MTGSLAMPMGREAVVTACVQAANVWWSDAVPVGTKWRRVAELHGRVALAHLVSTGRVFPLVEFVDALGGSLSSLLPPSMREDCDAVDLLEDGGLSSAAADLLLENMSPSVTAADMAGWSWKSLSAEKVQGWLFRQLLVTGSQSGYVEARSTVIRNSAGPLVGINDAIKRAGLPRDGLYESIPAWAWTVKDGQKYWFGCPICGWPMRVQLDRVTCQYRPHAEMLGWIAVVWQKSGTPQLGSFNRKKLPGIQVVRDRDCAAHPVEDHLCLVPAVWRYSTIPGLEECHLCEECNQIPGVHAALWPELDSYDLSVAQPNSKTWRIDVKDYTDPGRLASVLSSKAVLRDPSFRIVVPDYRSRQVPLLNERLNETFGTARRTYAMTSRQFLGMIRRSAATGTDGAR